MHANDPLIFRQLQVIQKIIEDETWLEGERRGCPVSRDDAVVRENVCRVILRIGKEMREAAMAAVQREARQEMASFSISRPAEELPLRHTAAA